MAKLKGPLLSHRAAGQFGRALIFDRYAGNNNAREYHKPSGDPTAAQLTARSVYGQLAHLWQKLPPGGREPWSAAARSRGPSGWNLMVRANLAALKDTAPQWTAFRASAGARGGPALAAFTYSFTFSSLYVVSYTARPLPPGWTNGVLCSILFHDPALAATIDSDVRYEEDTFIDDGAPHSVLLPAPLPMQHSIISAYIRAETPAGTLAYGPALTVKTNPA